MSDPGPDCLVTVLPPARFVGSPDIRCLSLGRRRGAVSRETGGGLDLLPGKDLPGRGQGGQAEGDAGRQRRPGGIEGDSQCQGPSPG